MTYTSDLSIQNGGEPIIIDKEIDLLTGSAHTVDIGLTWLLLFSHEDHITGWGVEVQGERRGTLLVGLPVKSEDPRHRGVAWDTKCDNRANPYTMRRFLVCFRDSITG